MKKKYCLPKSYGRLYKAVQEKKSWRISRDEFLRYCLATYLFAIDSYVGKIEDLSITTEDTDKLKELCDVNEYLPYNYNGVNLLVGLTQDEDEEDYLMKVEEMVNYFSFYQMLKGGTYERMIARETEYLKVGETLMPLLKRFRISLRLEYNKRRDGGMFPNGIEIDC